MDAGVTWERLLHTPMTWIVVAAVLFVIAVVLLVAGARASRRAARAQQATAAAGAPAPVDGRAGPADEGLDPDDDPVTEPAVPRRGPAAQAQPPESQAQAQELAAHAQSQASTAQARPQAAQVLVPTDEEDPATEPSPRTAANPTSGVPAIGGRATQRLLGALVGDPSGALAGVAALERGEEPGRAAVTLLRSGVPAPAVARLCGVDVDDLGDLVAATLGILPDQARAVVDEREAPAEPAAASIP